MRKWCYVDHSTKCDCRDLLKQCLISSAANEWTIRAHWKKCHGAGKGMRQKMTTHWRTESDVIVEKYHCICVGTHIAENESGDT
ncbi:hypothetical protein LSAT2_004818 [Lamellibrachia satsuma]|nr:hypothetical protein LSAT2_004818 [Lamellibrachia satsuma]